MKPVKLSFAVALVLAAMPLVSFAQDAEVVVEEEASSPLSVSLAATTDYVFRGVSQTDGGPAFQAGLTYTSPFGVYAGVWGSNVDFGGTGGFETDYFVGWNTDLSDSWNLDLGVTRYTYSGDGGFSGDYDEVIGKITWSGPVTITGLVAYAPDYGEQALRGIRYTRREPAERAMSDMRTRHPGFLDATYAAVATYGCFLSR